MSLLTVGQLPKTTSYVDRWEGAMIKVAADILNESPSTEHHAKRVALIEIILENLKDDEGIGDLTKVATNMARFALAINATLAASDTGGTDNDIEYVRNQLLANEFYLDKLLN